MSPFLRIVALAAALPVGLGACTDGPSPTGVDDSGGELESTFAGDPALGATSSDFSALTDPARPRCTYTEAVGRFVCEPWTYNGLTFTRSYAFYDLSGNSQHQRGATTHAMNVKTTVAGTTTRDGATITVDRRSHMTVSGLERSSTTHTTNALEQGTVTAVWSGSRGKVTTAETFQTKTTDVGVSVARDRNRWPLSGTVERSVTVTRSLEGSSETRSLAVRELVAFNGTNLVPVVITRDGVTKTCTRDLATRRTTCPR
jgi:hypothetical protein